MATLHRRGALLRLAVFSMVPLVSCRQPTPEERVLGERALMPPLSGDGLCRFDLTEEKTDTVFFVLGMLNEYNGRSLIEDDDRIEGFYCNEAATARLFRRYIGKLASEQGLDTTVRETTTQECLVSYHSKLIADRLNSCYRYEMTGGRLSHAPDGTYRRTARASLLADVFAQGIGVKDFSDNVSRRRALAYLAGAWARYGRDDAFVFANAREKATLVSLLLLNLSCHDVRIESTVGKIPQTNYVHFEPTTEVMEWLRKQW